MKFGTILPMIAASALLGSASVYAAEDAGARFTATLDGESEVTTQGGDPDGMGTATIRVNPGREQLCYSITVSNIGQAAAAHIHEAPAGVSGPVVFTLEAPTSGMSQGCVRISREDAKDFIKNPSDYYVNVHNAEFPGGAVRGQLGR